MPEHGCAMRLLFILSVFADCRGSTLLPATHATQGRSSEGRLHPAVVTIAALPRSNCKPLGVDHKPMTACLPMLFTMQILQWVQFAMQAIQPAPSLRPASWHR